MGDKTIRASDAFRNAIALVTHPADFMRQNKNLVVPVRSLIINYVAIFAAIPFFATLIGQLWYFTQGVGFAVASAIIAYVLDVVSVIIIGIVIWKLAPHFGTKTDQTRATILAAYMSTPGFLLSIVNVIPYLSPIILLGLLYGLYILGVGLPILLNTPSDKVIGYVLVVFVVSIVVWWFFDIVAVFGVASFF